MRSDRLIALTLPCLALFFCISCGDGKPNPEMEAQHQSRTGGLNSKVDPIQNFLNMIRAYNDSNLEDLLDAYSIDTFWQAPCAQRPPVRGNKIVVRQIVAFKVKLPESSITVRRIFGKGDMVVAQVVMNAVQRWDAQGIQKQKPVEMGCEMLYVVEADANGKLKATLLYVDPSTTQKQLGLVYGEAPPVPAKPKGEPEKVTGPAEAGIEDLAGKVFDLWGKSDYDEFEKMTASGFRYRDMRYGTSWDFARLKADDVEKKSVMSERIFKVEQVIAAGSYALVRYTMEAKYAVGSGVDKKIVPIAIHGADVLEFRDGKLAQMEAYRSEMELNAQISDVETTGPDASVSPNK